MLWLRPYTWVNRNGSAAIASMPTAVTMVYLSLGKMCYDEKSD